MDDSLKIKFQEIAENGELENLCKNRKKVRFSIGFFWKTLVDAGWKLQTKRKSCKWRITDPQGTVRVQGKSDHQLAEFFRGHAVSLKENFTWRGNCFYRYPGTGVGTVVLIHGWRSRSYFMSRIAVLLQKQGYTVLNYDYPTEKSGIIGHAKDFLECFRKENISGKLHFVTHSMGGLVFRHVLANMTEAECRSIDSIVMMGPPNQGSFLAFTGKFPFVRLFEPALGDMFPGSEALQIPLPSYFPPVGIIIADHDEKVAAKRTALPESVSYAKTFVHCDHNGLRLVKVTGEPILKFLQEKKF